MSKRTKISSEKTFRDVRKKKLGAGYLSHFFKPRHLTPRLTMLDYEVLRIFPTPRPDSVLLCDPRSTSYATLNAGSLYSSSGRARKDRDRLEDFWGGRMGRSVPAPHYAATCTVDQRELREQGAHCRTSGSHPPAACHPIGKGHTGRNVNGHLIATRERIVIRVHRDSNHLAKSSVMGSRGRWGGEFVGRKVDRNFSKKWTKRLE